MRSKELTRETRVFVASIATKGEFSATTIVGEVELGYEQSTELVGLQSPEYCPREKGGGKFVATFDLSIERRSSRHSSLCRRSRMFKTLRRSNRHFNANLWRRTHKIFLKDEGKGACKYSKTDRATNFILLGAPRFMEEPITLSSSPGSSTHTSSLSLGFIEEFEIPSLRAAPMAKPARGRPASPSGSDSRSSSRSRSVSRSRSRSRSYSGSGSHSSSRSRSRSRSFSSSSSRSGSSRSPSPAPRKSPAEGVKRGRSPPPQTKRTSPPPRKASPIPESLVLHVDQLSRNVNENHLKEIFGNFGEVVNVRLAIDHVVNIPKGFAYVEFKNRADAEKAQLYMDGAQVDGKVVRAKFTLPERKKVASPPKAVATTSRKDGPKSEDAAADGDKDGPKRPRDASPRGRPLSPPRRRSPLARRGSPRRGPGSPPPRRRADSPVRRKANSPYRRGDSPPPRRRPASPARGRSPSSPPRRFRSPPRGSPRRMRGSPVRRRSPFPPRRRSPRRARSPPRRSPIGRRRSRSPVRRLARSPSGSLSPRRGRGPPARRGRSSSSSRSPRKGPRRGSRSRSPRRPIRGRSPSSSSTSSSPPPARKP
ncbi:serine/arginine-rich splicing factor sr45 [Phtheirospermum japonicum]|uniref:Serine/arginine-rich splicing factor sr45 n=1 Tax=Phtheirospermum japonicum TaxID=374723 RepID=A0A830CYA2_9LAMI|nr:serine/arginine-rich splicing factor sr45 [Phtheirospermum japonicum]